MSDSSAHVRLRVKRGIPWPIKFGIKLALGVAGVDYRTLKRAGIVEHGRMEHADFVREIVAAHVQEPLARWGKRPSGALLELGPGDSVATGAIGQALGFDTTYLIDADRFADLRPAQLDRLFESLGVEPLRLPETATPPAVIETLASRGIRYRTDGVGSFRDIADGSVGHSFSNTVLQHVVRSDVPELIRELGRVHRPGGLSSHCINYTDHFSGGYVNHRLPPRLMESGLIKRAHLYTNRLSPLDYAEMFEQARFDARRLWVEFYGPEPRESVEYHSVAALRAGVGSRRVLQSLYVFHKKVSGEGR